MNGRESERLSKGPTSSTSSIKNSIIRSRPLGRRTFNPQVVAVERADREQKAEQATRVYQEAISSLHKSKRTLLVDCCYLNPSSGAYKYYSVYNTYDYCYGVYDSSYYDPGNSGGGNRRLVEAVKETEESWGRNLGTCSCASCSCNCYASNPCS